MGEKGASLQLVLKELYAQSQALTPRNTAQTRRRKDHYSFLTHPSAFTSFPVLCKSPFVFIRVISPGELTRTGGHDFHFVKCESHYFHF